MGTGYLTRSKQWTRALAVAVGLVVIALTQATAETEQRVEITIKDFAYITRQMPLQLNVPTVIVIRNEDAVRHDFGSSIFQRSLAQAESGGVITYGKGIEGIFLDPQREAQVRFTLERPGRYEFRCSVHPNMKGEILLINVGAA